MLGFLFRTLTARPDQGAALHDSLTAEARRPHWYVEGAVPDTIDGRFAVLATVTALAMVRLEREGEAGNRSSVALTERFIEVMETEHRELGLGDPTLGRQVRKLVGSLSRRVELWRAAVNNERDWTAAARESLYKDEVSPDALMHSGTALREFWSKLGGVGVDALVDGRLG
jgi:cytochrome b pre-mRNA-processing protein 3